MSASTPQHLQSLGDYLLIERIGEGGMAEVFRAQYTGPPKSTGPAGMVVVKRIRPELFKQPEFPIFRAMFLNEAKLVQRLRHPNLARVFALCEAVDQQSGVLVPFIVGEFVQGRELWELMRVATRGFGGAGVPAGVSAYIVREVARGLGHAHAHTDADSGRAAPIIHRDVSPENVLISNDGQVKVIDFGVAKALGGLGPQTRTGMIKGKLAYMAPEQVAQRPVPATDVFGAGIVLYELLTGRRLFGGQNDFLVVQRVLKAAIPPPGQRVPMPAALDQVVMRALDRNLSRRYRDGNQLADALTDVLERVPELRGSGPLALQAWVGSVLQQSLRQSRQRISEQDSDLHVDLGQALRVVADNRSETLELADEDLLFDALEGALEGPIDPIVHAAVTQGMRTLRPDMLAPPPPPSSASSRPTQRSDPGLPGVAPPPSRPSAPVLAQPAAPALRSGREVTAPMLQREPGIPRWAMIMMGLMALVVVVLLVLLLARD